MLGRLVVGALLARASSESSLVGHDLNGSWPGDGADIGMGLVQKQIEWHGKGARLLYGLPRAQSRTDQDCNEKHWDDLYRPVGQVLAEHPGVDGNCWFHFYADYLNTPPSHLESVKSTIAEYSVNAGKGLEATLHLTNGERLTTHLDGNWGMYPYDDAMCYMMGWLKGQHLDKDVMKLMDEQAWLNVSERECKRLPGMLDGPLDEKKLTIGYMQDDNDRICLASECLMFPANPFCKRATLEDYVYHLYPKCLLGGDRLTGASGQISWCYARACITEGNVIKHGDECWPDGLPF
mmetsp:Transcript_6841/g.16158  ORF Transcript_6841/g.16158 Transcript_6841/m.16158 type:complete len:293 (-) Transcript_6841:44-922(-)